MWTSPMGEMKWWLVGNNYGGIRFVYAKNARRAAATYRYVIYEAMLFEGWAQSKAREWGRGYGPTVWEGPLTEDRMAEIERDELSAMEPETIGRLVDHCETTP